MLGQHDFKSALGSASMPSIRALTFWSDFAASTTRLLTQARNWVASQAMARICQSVRNASQLVAQALNVASEVACSAGWPSTSACAWIAHQWSMTRCCASR
ncbi:hypothetical protein G7085_09060 [Tessaracoccus sp. HDW20]|uniref:hypothetical protein n=1 Tax=Tessaracoccus coleopterorum TaxID=2714950 RepID=UPI0018D4BD0D|nr:hypothetical protein [Tessaracoccus coleopterorum]NHB84710.1 hypothetical protein [Tessaracoccus coleopterorum]